MSDDMLDQRTRQRLEDLLDIVEQDAKLIQNLRREIEKLRDALKPFSDAASTDDYVDDIEIAETDTARKITFGDLRRARAAIEGVTEPASLWRDIESAPKDGTLIQVWRKNRNVVTAYWIKNQSCWKNPNIEIPALYDPTHWMPLPEPPR